MRGMLRWFCIVLFLLGCARTYVAPEMTVRDLTPDYQTGRMAAKVDGFLVLLDASSSMSEGDGDYMKFDLAKSLVQRMNQTLPPLDITGGLRSFGHDPSLSNAKTALFYGMAPYQRTALKQGLDMVARPGGTTPMADALLAAAGDFKAVDGRLALIVISDGKDVGTEPLRAADTLKSAFGERICIYTILVGEDVQGASLMQQLAAVTPCGFTAAARSLTSAEAMAGFVQKVFLEKGLDSDSDGVLDVNDKCPGTPKGVAVDARGCPLDSDGDGVPDYLDQCPNTPAGTPVDAKGCALKSDLDADGDGVVDSKDRCPNTPKGAKVNAVGCWVVANVFFDTNKADIKPEMKPGLDEALQVLSQNPQLRIEVQGHTDSDGADAYNQNLSERRAKAVADHFVQQGIAADRISSKGYGETQPVADNKTKEGKAQNRRVELRPIE
jgi:OmpA-OmpF porin, OOP family